MTIETDEDLVRRFLASGEVEDFEALVRRHQRGVFRIAMSVLGMGREAEAEDVAQEVFVQVYRNLGGFEGRSRFSTWLYRIAYRRAIDHARSIRFRTGEQVVDLTGGVAPGDPLRDRALYDCIARLPVAQRGAIRLHYWMGETVTEIAQLLGVQPGTVKSWLFRARHLLNECLDSKGVRR